MRLTISVPDSTASPPQPRHRGRSILFGALALAWMAAIFVVSSGPVPPVVNDPLLDAVAKKVGHASAYAILAVLWWLSIREQRAPQASLIAAFVIAAAYGASDELHQAFTATRHPSAVDIAIDALGAATGLWATARVFAGRATPAIEPDAESDPG
jgi:hypothetical protein